MIQTVSKEKILFHPEQNNHGSFHLYTNKKLG